jgi:DNA-directed RNA polymerase beta subunit
MTTLTQKKGRGSEWDVAECVIRSQGLIPFQIDSYNSFVENINQNLPTPIVISCSKPKVPIEDCKQIQHRITLKNVTFHKPKFVELDSNNKHPSKFQKGDNAHSITPNEVRARNLFYSSGLHIDIIHELYAKNDKSDVIASKSKEFKQVYMGEFPVMVRSKLCNLNSPSFFHANENLIKNKECFYDEGGYFIIGGVEKCLIGQERMESNKIFVWPKPPNEFTAENRSQYEYTNLQPSQFKVKMVKFKQKWNIECRMPFLDYNLPLFILFGALGVNSITSIIQIILGSREDYKDEHVSAQVDEENIHAGKRCHLSKKDYERMKNYFVDMIEEFECFDQYKTQEGCLEFIDSVAVKNTSAYDNLIKFFSLQKEQINKIKTLTISAEDTSILQENFQKSLILNHPEYLPKWKTYISSNMFTKIFDEEDNEDKIQSQAYHLNNFEQIRRIIIQFCEEQILEIQSNIQRKHRESNIGMLNKDFLPHLGNTKSDFKRKICFLGMMVQNILLVAIGKKEPDNRDLLFHKRLDTSGETIKRLFLETMRNVVKELNTWGMRMGDFMPMNEIRSKMKKKSPLILLKTVIKKGIWGPVLNPNAKTGISTNVQAVCFPAFISLMNRISTSLQKRTAKIAGPRNLNSCHWGYLCATETPDTDAVGLVKNRTILCHCTQGSSSNILIPLIQSNYPDLIQKLDDIDYSEIHYNYRVLINGFWIGNTPDPHKLAGFIREMRRQLLIHYETGVSVSEVNKDVSIRTDQGRLIRPLFLVNPETGKTYWPGYLTFEEFYGHCSVLMKKRYIEFIDVEESENCYIAMYHHQATLKHTHTEIHPASLNGHIAGLTTFAEYDPTARLLFGNQMKKQFCGCPRLNYATHFNSGSKHQLYPQKPLVSNPISAISNFDEVPDTQNLVVMVKSDENNQEDCIEMSERFRQFAGAAVVHSKSYQGEEIKDGNKYVETLGVANYEDQFSRNALKHNKNHNIDSDGTAPPQSFVSVGESLIAKKTVDKTTKQERDVSKDSRCTQNGVVDCVILVNNASGTRSCKVRVLSSEKPIPGDKFTSNHTQKGVLAAQFIKPSDAPFDEDSGITPDIIINPCAFPSRQTIGQLLEMLAGIVAAVKAERYEISMFDTPEPGKPTLQYFEEQMVELGFDMHGYQNFVCGITGKPFESKICVGIANYGPLKHMIKQKYHARSTGPVNFVTRQAPEGRVNNGGGRVGEMEKDVLLVHGTTDTLNDRMHRRSDATHIYVCNTCGNVAHPLGISKTVYCPVCNVFDKNIFKTSIPYSTSTFFTESKALHTRMDLQVGPNDHEIRSHKSIKK